MTTYLTKAGVVKMEADLKEARAQKKIVTEELRVARAHGDLKENGEFHAAKERLGQIVERITVIQYKMADLQVVDPSQLKLDTAILGTRVKVKDLKTGDEDTYTLVGPDEADPVSGKISMVSPLGRAFLGHKPKEKVPAALPAGPREFLILSILPVE